jgi:ribose transport system ATP-binding protein
MTQNLVPGGQTRSALDARGLTKTFAGVVALNKVDLTVEPGEVHALLGENGSGKSTFIKILSGYHNPDPGSEVRIDGKAMQLGSPDPAYELGCRFVHQDLGLIDSSSVVDNLCMNTGFPTRFGTVRQRSARRRARTDLARVGLEHVQPESLVGALTPAMKTGVAVARALRQDSDETVKLLVLDEPTATLPDNEVQHLLGIVRQVAASGVGVLYVTHRLDEVFQVADRVTVLRDGRKAATEPTTALDRRRLINLLVGSELDELHATASVSGAYAGYVRSWQVPANPGYNTIELSTWGDGSKYRVTRLDGTPRTAWVSIDGSQRKYLKVRACASAFDHTMNAAH